MRKPTSQGPVKPCSQLGLMRIPQSPRRPRAFKAREGQTSIYRTPKGMFYGERYLHATKGWRYPGIRAAHATLVTAEIKRGIMPWSSHRFQDMLKAEGII